MDAMKNYGGDGGGLWTNEKHSSYLNRMEASFVRSLYTNDKSSPTGHTPLARRLPDSLESTCDSKPSRNQPEEANDTTSTANNARKSGKKTRRRCSGPYGASQDQVVPQFGKCKADKEDEGRNL